MNTELTTATANRVYDLDISFDKRIQIAKEAINGATMDAVEIGGYIQQISKGQRIAWLRDNVPNISHKKIAKYLSIEATYRKRPNNMLDQRHLNLLGMIDEEVVSDTTEARPIRLATPQWLAWSGKLTGYLSEMVKTSPPDTWEEAEKDAFAAQLKPIVDLYNKIIG